MRSRPFGWRWIVREFRLRKGHTALLAALIGLSYWTGLIFPVALQQIIDAIVAGRVDGWLVGLAAAAIAAIATEVGMEWLRRRVNAGLTLFIDRRISRRIFCHLMRIRFDGAQSQAGDLLALFDERERIYEFVLYTAPILMVDIGGAAVGLGLAYAYDVAFGATLTAALPVVAMIGRRRGAGMEDAYDVQVGAKAAYQGVVTETVHGLPTVKALAIEGERVRRFERASAALSRANRNVSVAGIRYNLQSQIIARGVTLVVTGIGCWRLYQGDLTVGGLLALQVITGRITSPISHLGLFLEQTRKANVAVRRIAAFLAQPSERAEKQPPRRQFDEHGIAITDLSLTYPGAARPALDGISLTLPPRGVVAIVGRNGSGKSTLMRILLGLQRDYAGRVEIAGGEVRDYDPRWLRSRIGTVDQETILFSGTVRDVVSTGRHHEAAIREALRFAGALDFVEALPGGLDAPLGENGRTLSGGQRQRLSIARAVLRDPAMAILDEPTAFLDPEAALALEQRLAAWGRDRLLLLVTHHLAAARQAATIVVLDGGRLVGTGTHEALLTTVPVYASLWADYTRSVKAEPAALIPA